MTDQNGYGSPADLEDEPDEFWTPFRQQLAQWVAVLTKDRNDNRRSV